MPRRGAAMHATLVAGMLASLAIGASTASVDDVDWTARERALIGSLSIDRLGEPPPDPSNRVADDADAAALGERLFFDARLSADGSVSCASCHRPALAFADDVPVSEGIGKTRRNTPTLLGSGYQAWFYWDGRRDSQWAQALTPIEHPDEQNLSRIDVLRLVATDESYVRGYRAVFGALPAVADNERFPPGARPEGPVGVRRAWFAMDETDRAAVNTAFANIGKALAAYGRLLKPAPSRFDRYARALESGDAAAAAAAMSASEVEGLRLFVGERAQCVRCHNGPLLSNGGFHNIGLEMRGASGVDVGRAAGVRDVLSDPFNCLGDFSDAQPEQCAELSFMRTSGEELPGAFKVPTLRDVDRTAPYMHDGRFATLEAVLAHYANPPVDVLGHQELETAPLSATEIAALAAFLRALSGEPAADVAVPTPR